MSELIFQKCLAFTLPHEGVKFTDDPDDAGGPTRFGITQVIYDEYCDQHKMPKQSVKLINKNTAIDVYRQMFWMASYAYLFEYPLALAIFDTQVQFNPATKAALLNQALNLIPVASSLQRLNSLKALTPAQQVPIATNLANARYKFRADLVARYPNQYKYLAGWQKRDKDLLRQIQLYAISAKVKKFAMSLWSSCKSLVGVR